MFDIEKKITLKDGFLVHFSNIKPMGYYDIKPMNSDI